MNTTTKQTSRRFAKRIACIVVGHRRWWQRRPDHTVLLTCLRCGHVDVVEDVGEQVFDAWAFVGSIGSGGAGGGCLADDRMTMTGQRPTARQRRVPLGTYPARRTALVWSAVSWLHRIPVFRESNNVP